MLDKLLVSGFLLACYCYLVYLTGNTVVSSQRALAYYFLVKRCRQGERDVCTAKAVHFGEGIVP